MYFLAFSMRMFSNEDVTVGSWMLAMNVHHEDNRAICDPRCTHTSIAVWDIPKCSGNINYLHNFSIIKLFDTLFVPLWLLYFPIKHWFQSISGQEYNFIIYREIWYIDYLPERKPYSFELGPRAKQAKLAQILNLKCFTNVLSKKKKLFYEPKLEEPTLRLVSAT